MNLSQPKPRNQGVVEIGVIYIRDHCWSNMLRFLCGMYKNVFLVSVAKSNGLSILKYYYCPLFPLEGVVDVLFPGLIIDF